MSTCSDVLEFELKALKEMKLRTVQGIFGVEQEPDPAVNEVFSLQLPLVCPSRFEHLSHIVVRKRTSLLVAQETDPVASVVDCNTLRTLHLLFLRGVRRVHKKSIACFRSKHNKKNALMSISVETLMRHNRTWFVLGILGHVLSCP